MKMLVARSYFFINFYYQYQLSVVSVLSLFFILSPVPLFIFVFLDVYNSYNRSLLKMYVVAYETSSNTENFYYTMRCLWIMLVTAVCFLFLVKRFSSFGRCCLLCGSNNIFKYNECVCWQQTARAYSFIGKGCSLQAFVRKLKNKAPGPESI